MSIFGGEAIIQPQAEMEAEQEDAPRHRMSVCALCSLPQPHAKQEVARSRPHVWGKASDSRVITIRKR